MSGITFPLVKMLISTMTSLLTDSLYELLISRIKFQLVKTIILDICNCIFTKCHPRLPFVFSCWCQERIS